MTTPPDYTVNVRGTLLSLAEPRVMGILNATPDSFFAGSRMQTEADMARRAVQIVEEGGTIIDVGACSTRPGSTAVDEAEEMNRLRTALAVVRRECPDTVLSVDTYRSEVARMAVEEYGADIINDVGESPSDRQSADGSTPEERRRSMFDMVARLRVPYILACARDTLDALMISFADEVQQLRSRGVKDIILDPGFGFGKTLDDNYAVLRCMERLRELELPLLVGVSRKSMIWRTLGCTPEEALNGTTVLHTVALMKGASILRSHDVKAAVECVRLTDAVHRAEGGGIRGRK